MACQLPADCLSEILEYLENDELTLYSCLLVNHLWCNISVRILWRNILHFKSQERPLRVASSILSTLIACLPNESKELLRKNKIFIPPPTSKPPLFNYAAFCKALLLCEISQIVRIIISELNIELSSNDRNVTSLVTNEITKMFANQIFSLKKLGCYNYYNYQINFSSNYFPGAKDLSELCCKSDLSSDFFYRLSQVCHNLQSISIDFINGATNELKELISLQNNLKNITLSAFDGESWADIIPALTKYPDSITKLCLYSDSDNLPLSFIGLFPNLQEIILSFPNSFRIFNYDDFTKSFTDFRKLQHSNFSKLQTLKIPFYCPKVEYVIKFLENNGKNLRKLYISRSGKALSLTISNFCPNITSLYVAFKNDELDILKNILISCHNLESIKILCGVWYYLNEKEVLETVVNHSSNKFHELKIYSSSYSFVSSEDLETFFICWKSRIPNKLLTLIMINNNYYISLNKDNMKIIEKYENLGIIKFEIRSYDDEEKGEEFHYYFF
jgi:hypothetical protein